jgi:hypothetical protein
MTYAIVMDLTKAKIEKLLKYMEQIQALSLIDSTIEGFVLANMEACFVKCDNDIWGLTNATIKQDALKGVECLPAAMNITMLPGWFHFDGIPENTDLMFHSIAVHQHLLVTALEKCPA